MKPLTQKEIDFIKETGWTPTVEQADEWYRTIFPKLLKEPTDSDYYINMNKSDAEKYFEKIDELCLQKYNIDLTELYKKCVDEYDEITLENDATYLFYSFFTKEELKKLTDKEATKWLKDFKYHCGYRKWDGGNLSFVNEAIMVYDNEASFYTDEDNDIWWFDEEQVNSELFTKYEVEK